MSLKEVWFLHLVSELFTGPTTHAKNIIVVFPDDLVKTDSAGKSEAFLFLPINY